MPDITFVLSIVGVISGLIALYVSLRKLPLDLQKQKSDFEAAKTKRIVLLETRVSNLETQVEAQAKIIKKLRGENNDLKKWADKLVHQVVELGGIPVEFESAEKDSVV